MARAARPQRTVTCTTTTATTTTSTSASLFVNDDERGRRSAPRLARVRLVAERRGGAPRHAHASAVRRVDVGPSPTRARQAQEARPGRHRVARAPHSLRTASRRQAQAHLNKQRDARQRRTPARLRATRPRAPDALALRVAQEPRVAVSPRAGAVQEAQEKGQLSTFQTQTNKHTNLNRTKKRAFIKERLLKFLLSKNIFEF